MQNIIAFVAAMLSVIAVYLPTRAQSFRTIVVEGRRMRTLMMGDGDTVVVFENGAGGSLEMLGKVQRGVSQFARTISYDRAGVGLSDPGPLPRDGHRVAFELRELLRVAAIRPPYILVGASFGGPFVKIFADLYPDDVAAMVLVDPTPDTMPPDNDGGLPELQSRAVTLDQSRLSRVPNVPVFLIDALSLSEVPFATATIRAQRRNNTAEIEAESLAYKHWLATVPKGRLTTTDRSGHNVALEQPDLVIDTIRAAVDEVAHVRR